MEPLRVSETARRPAARIAAVVICAGGLLYFAHVLDGYYPLRAWLVWRLAIIWSWQLLFVVGCLCAGDLVLTRVLRVRDLPRLETVVMSMACGVAAFVTAMYLLGAARLYRPPLAVALPLLFAVADRARLLALTRDLSRRWRQRPAPRLSVSPAVALVSGGGLIGLAVLYLGLLTPSAISCDAGWFHMSAAADFVREGRLVAQIGDWAKALPQLTAILHTWAFLIPGLRVEEHWMLGLHTEFVLFLFTLAAVVASVRWLLRSETGTPHAWAAFFLFPAIFIYDSNLGGSADHVHAFFVLPLLLAALRAIERPDPRMAALAGVAAGGALSTKVQALYVIAPVAALFVASALWTGFARRPPRTPVERRWALADIGFFALGLLAVVAPQLIKNAVFHRNPVYPFLQDVFRGSRPTVPGAQALFFRHLAPVVRKPFWDNVAISLRRLAWYSFDVHNGHAPANLPFLGSLFTLLLPVALLARERRLWLAILVALGALFCWSFAFPMARNLQTFTPVLVAITAGLMAQVWRFGVAARIALVALGGLQLIWGADQAIASERGRIIDAMSLATSGLEGRSRTRFDGYLSGLRAVDKALPRDAVVLLHTSYQQLGIGRRTLLDWPGFQGLIDYRPMRSAGDVYQRFHELGVTHVATTPGWPAHSRQEEVVFDAFLYRNTRSLGRVGDFMLWAMPDGAPPVEAPYRVLCLSVGGYADGVYRVEQLDNLDDGPPAPRAPEVTLGPGFSAASLMARADAVVSGSGAVAGADGAVTLARDFEPVAGYTAYSVFLRRSLAR